MYHRQPRPGGIFTKHRLYSPRICVECYQNNPWTPHEPARWVYYEGEGGALPSYLCDEHAIANGMNPNMIRRQ